MPNNSFKADAFGATLTPTLALLEIKMDKKKITGFVGVIILGALGSGLWELFKPILSLGANLILTISTLGLDNLRNGMYEDASSFLRKPPGMASLLITTCMVVCLVGISVISYIRHSLNAKHEGFARLHYLILYGFLTLISITSFRATYIEGLATHYLKSKTIFAPYLTDQEIKIIDAKYAKISSKKDYISVISQLSNVANKNGEELPIRDFF